jgi:preprotein translocase subunit SecE
MGSKKYIQLLFGIGALVLYFLLTWTIEWVWGYFAKPPDLAINMIALGAALATVFVLYRNDGVFGSASDVVRELEKVTWPSRKETSVNTMVVLVTVTIAALIMSAYDAVWSFVTSKVLG